MDQETLDLKCTIYGLIKICRDRPYTIHEEQVFRSAIGYLSDALYTMEVAVAKSKQAMIDSARAGLEQARIRAEVKDR